MVKIGCWKMDGVGAGEVFFFDDGRRG